MRSREEVLKRLKKLRGRYARQFLKVSQDRLHRNCKHNCEHLPQGQVPAAADQDGGPIRMVAGEDVEGLIAPDRLVRFGRSVSLVVLHDPAPVRLCMYGSDNPASWAGELCDRDEKAASCPWFSPAVSLQSATAVFDGLMADDEYVYENYKDIAAIQWVLEDRVHKHRHGLWERLSWWFASFFVSRPRALPPPPVPDEDMEDIWRDDSA